MVQLFLDFSDVKTNNMQTNLKDALKNADGIKSPMGDVACYSMNFAELASEINVHLGWNRRDLRGLCREAVIVSSARLRPVSVLPAR